MDFCQIIIVKLSVLLSLAVKVEANHFWWSAEKTVWQDWNLPDVPLNFHSTWLHAKA